VAADVEKVLQPFQQLWIRTGIGNPQGIETERFGLMAQRAGQVVCNGGIGQKSRST
jgi:hypothetical protein